MGFYDNNVNLLGRLTRDPEIRYSTGENALAIARFTVAVERRFKKAGEQDANFIPCVAFGKSAEFAERYLKQGTKVSINGHITTGSYTNKEGNKVYKVEVAIDDMGFAESKAASQRNAESNSNTYKPSSNPTPTTNSDGFMNIPDGIDEELPFN